MLEKPKLDGIICGNSLSPEFMAKLQEIEEKSKGQPSNTGEVKEEVSSSKKRKRNRRDNSKKSEELKTLQEPIYEALSSILSPLTRELSQYSVLQKLILEQSSALDNANLLIKQMTVSLAKEKEDNNELRKFANEYAKRINKSNENYNAIAKQLVGEWEKNQRLTNELERRDKVISKLTKRIGELEGEKFIEGFYYQEGETITAKNSSEELGQLTSTPDILFEELRSREMEGVSNISQILQDSTQLIEEGAAPNFKITLPSDFWQQYVEKGMKESRRQID